MTKKLEDNSRSGEIISIYNLTKKSRNSRKCLGSPRKKWRVNLQPLMDQAEAEQANMSTK